MKKLLAQKLLTATALVAALFVGSGFAIAADKTAKVFTTCNGGVQEAVFTNTQNVQAAKAGAVAAPIPFTPIAGGGSGGGADSDLYTVTFSGEADGTVGGFWEAQAQVSVNGGAFVPIDPVGPNTFLTGIDAQTHTMTWCRRLIANNTVFRIMWAKFGGGVALIDDYLMRVERSD